MRHWLNPAWFDRLLSYFSWEAWVKASQSGRWPLSLSAPRPSARRAFLSLVQLEDRCVPTTLYVLTGGSIQAKVDEAHTGDIIQVAAGTFSEHVEVDKSLTIEGANYGTAGNSGSRVAETVVDGGLTGAPFAIDASGVVIDGFDIINGQGGRDAGVAISPYATGTQVLNSVINLNTIGIYLNGTDTLVAHDLIENSGTDPYGSADGSGIYADDSANAVVTANVFTNNYNGPMTFGAVEAGDHTDLTISDNVVNDVNLATLLGVSGATISGNTFTSTDEYSAIGFVGADTDISVTGNTFLGGTSGLRVLDAYGLGPNDSISAHFNRFVGQSVAGVNIDDGGYATGETLDATDNWWGSNAETITYGPANVDPWIVLSASAPPLPWSCPARPSATSRWISITTRTVRTYPPWATSPARWRWDSARTSGRWGRRR